MQWQSLPVKFLPLLPSFVQPFHQAGPSLWCQRSQSKGLGRGFQYGVVKWFWAQQVLLSSRGGACFVQHVCSACFGQGRVLQGKGNLILDKQISNFVKFQFFQKRFHTIKMINVVPLFCWLLPSLCSKFPCPQPRKRKLCKKIRPNVIFLRIFLNKANWCKIYVFYVTPGGFHLVLHCQCNIFCKLDSSWYMIILFRRRKQNLFKIQFDWLVHISRFFFSAFSDF